MPFPNYHTARLRDPNDFDRFTVKKTERGVMLVIGWLPDGGSDVQSVRFRASKWTPRECRKWLRIKKLRPIAFESGINGSEDTADELSKALSDPLVRNRALTTADSALTAELDPTLWATSILVRGDF